jgi:hypothetical protein
MNRRNFRALAHPSPLPLTRTAPPTFGPFLKASMVGFTLYSRAFYYYCVDEVPPPRSHPTTVTGRGTGGYYLIKYV